MAVLVHCLSANKFHRHGREIKVKTPTETVPRLQRSDRTHLGRKEGAKVLCEQKVTHPLHLLPFHIRVKIK